MSVVRALVGSLILAFAIPAAAQSYPARPVRIVVGSTPGGSADLIARAIAQKLGETWTQPITVDNRPGNADVIGTDHVAKSAGDGYTWLLAPNNVMVIAPHLSKPPFDVFKDFTPVAQVVTVPFMLVVHPQVPAKSLAELIAFAKANPNKLNYGSSGNGSPQHLSAEMIKRAAGIEMTHVPYKGSAPAVTDLVGGRLQVFVGVVGQLLPHIKDARLRPLANAGGKRLAAFPELPTIAEILPAFGTELGDPWMGVFMPANVPKDIVTRVNAEIVRVLNLPDVKSQLAARGFEVATGTPEALGARVSADSAHWARIIREAGIKAD